MYACRYVHVHISTYTIFYMSKRAEYNLTLAQRRVALIRT